MPAEEGVEAVVVVAVGEDLDTAPAMAVDTLREVVHMPAEEEVAAVEEQAATVMDLEAAMAPALVTVMPEDHMVDTPVVAAVEVAEAVVDLMAEVAPGMDPGVAPDMVLARVATPELEAAEAAVAVVVAATVATDMGPVRALATDMLVEDTILEAPPPYFGLVLKYEKYLYRLQSVATHVSKNKVDARMLRHACT
jgi:hypothetical protein